MIKYKEFIEDNFTIKTKEGKIVPFIFNETQNFAYNLLLDSYKHERGMRRMSGIRENWLKFRQWGGSSLIDAIFATDFIFAETAQVPITDGQIISHKKEEVKPLFMRVEHYIRSYCEKQGIRWDQLISRESRGTLLQGHRDSRLFVGSAQAGVLGRGDTMFNLHWSEVAFYPNSEILNAETLITSAEEMIPEIQGKLIGKIFRETTGNIRGDFFHTEFYAAIEGESDFNSRFLGWWLHKDYHRKAPAGWKIPIYYHRLANQYKISKDQIYWHFKKTHKQVGETWVMIPKKIREYPSYPEEAFLAGGQQYFDREAMLFYDTIIRDPIKKDIIYL